VESTWAEGRSAILAGVPPFVRKTLDLVGFSGRVVMTETVEEAVRSLAK
jgi:anti-anti-sigma regulatory factor